LKSVELKTICAAVNGRLIGRRRGMVSGVATDTRELTRGDAFFALVAKRDGHEFVAEARRAGASVVVVSEHVSIPRGSTAILVGDTLKALGDLAAWYRRTMPATVIGITGSNGKTTTKEMIARVLAAAAPTIKSPESFNNAIGVPRTLFEIEPGDVYGVVEMGTSAPGEIRRLARIARPQIGVITNIAPTHLAGLGNIKGVAVEKGCLIEELPPGGAAVLNVDNHWCRELAERSPAHVITFGIDENALVRATGLEASASAIRFEALGTKFVMPVIGRHNVYNALAAVAVCVHLGLDIDLIRDRLAGFRLPPMRMQRVEAGDVTILNDAYNANFESMLAAIREYARLPGPGRKVVVCGDMLELGEQSEEIHRQVGKRIAAAEFDLLVAIGDEARQIAAGAAANGMPRDNVLHCRNVDAACEVLPGLVEPRDTLLLKASRGMRLENVVDVVASHRPAETPVWTDAGHVYHAFRAPAERESVGMQE